MFLGSDGVGEGAVCSLSEAAAAGVLGLSAGLGRGGASGGPCSGPSRAEVLALAVGTQRQARVTGVAAHHSSVPDKGFPRAALGAGSRVGLVWASPLPVREPGAEEPPCPGAVGMALSCRTGIWWPRIDGGWAAWWAEPSGGGRLPTVRFLPQTAVLTCLWGWGRHWGASVPHMPGSCPHTRPTEAS